MYKIAYKNNFFGKVIIEKFKDEESAVDALKNLENKYFICYTDVEMNLYRGWMGKVPKSIIKRLWYSIIHPMVTELEIFKIEKPELYQSIRWYFYIHPVAFLCYIGLILTWIPWSSASFLEKVAITTLLLTSCRSIKHGMESAAMEKLILSTLNKLDKTQ